MVQVVTQPVRTSGQWARGAKLLRVTRAGLSVVVDDCCLKQGRIRAAQPKAVVHRLAIRISLASHSGLGRRPRPERHGFLQRSPRVSTPIPLTGDPLLNTYRVASDSLLKLRLHRRHPRPQIGQGNRGRRRLGPVCDEGRGRNALGRRVPRRQPGPAQRGHAVGPGRLVRVGLHERQRPRRHGGVGRPGPHGRIGGMGRAQEEHALARVPGRDTARNREVGGGARSRLGRIGVAPRIATSSVAGPVPFRYSCVVKRSSCTGR